MHSLRFFFVLCRSVGRAKVPSGGKYCININSTTWEWIGYLSTRIEAVTDQYLAVDLRLLAVDLLLLAVYTVMSHLVIVPRCSAVLCSRGRVEYFGSELMWSYHTDASSVVVVRHGAVMSP